VLLDTFCDAVWLEDGLAKNTLESYRRDLRIFAEWLRSRGGNSLLQAAEADLSEYFAWRFSQHGKKRGGRSSTQARIHSSLKRFYRYLVAGVRST
jgi:integrase/recombinase XerD